jgi:hypothetical protein
MKRILNLQRVVSGLLLVVLSGSSAGRMDVSMSYPLMAMQMYNTDLHDSLRIDYDLKAIEISSEIGRLKTQGENLPARLLNNLYSTFNRQLEFDKACLNILDTIDFNKDSLTVEQRKALKQLLMVSQFYYKIYSSNEYVKRILNLGNISYEIPVDVLMVYESILFSEAYRKTLSRTNTADGAFDYSGFIEQLPPSRSDVEAFIDIDNSLDLPFKAFESITFNGAYLFISIVGYFEGSYEARHNASKLLEVLQPYDIVLMKSSQNLTDFFIPGYFGHAAIWLGSDRNHIFSENLSKPNIDSRFMIEAVREGVKMSSLEEFSSGEVFLVLRPKNLSLAQKGSVFHNSTIHLGKPYDFNFDSEAADMISCPELAFLAYDFINWETGSLLNKTFITPDDIFATATQDASLEIVALIDHGKLIQEPDVDELIFQVEN